MTKTQTERINDKLTIYLRPRSTRGQGSIRLQNGEWHRFSTGKTDFEEAKEEALKHYYTADFKQKNQLPPSTRKFRRVAEFAKQRMQEELDSGGGRVVFRDYITAVDRYSSVIPAFSLLPPQISLWLLRSRACRHSCLGEMYSALEQKGEAPPQRAHLKAGLETELNPAPPNLREEHS